MSTDTRAQYRNRKGHKSGSSWNEGVSSRSLAPEWKPFGHHEPHLDFSAGGGPNVGKPRTEYGGDPARLSVFRKGHTTVELTQERPEMIRRGKPRHTRRSQSRSATLDTATTLARPPPRSTVEQHVPRKMERVSPSPLNRRERRTQSQPPARPNFVSALGTWFDNAKALVGQRPKEKSAIEKNAGEKRTVEKSVDADEVFYQDIEQIHDELIRPIELMYKESDRTPKNLRKKSNLAAKSFAQVVGREVDALEKWRRTNSVDQERDFPWDPPFHQSASAWQRDPALIDKWRKGVARSGTI